MRTVDYSEIYEAITSSDADFIEGIVEAALYQAAEVTADLWSDEPTSEAPDANDIREHAIAYTEDMIKEFTKQVLERIKRVEFVKIEG